MREPIEHELKCWPEFFEAIRDGRKPFEYRLNDRDFQVGDALYLREWVPDIGDHDDHGEAMGGYYTGRELRRRVPYILDLPLGPTAKAGFVVMTLAEI